MIATRLIIVTLAVLALTPGASAVSFNRDIRPILADRCFACHGPDSASRKAGLRLDKEEFAKAALADSDLVPIVPGAPERSAVWHRISSEDPDEIMPPPEAKSELGPSEIAAIQQWISEGAKWERHWAFIPPERGSPEIGDSDWPRSAIDEFVYQRLVTDGLAPSPRASKERLLRRLSFDLTGLPPTLEELDAFLADDSPEAYEKQVDRLLASPSFGERLALEWLDVARYGDTDGLFEDHPRSIYPWRDWLVRAFNDNLPYNQFIEWQLAGDLLESATTDQKLATGFLRNNPTSNEGGIIDEDYRIKYLVDRVNTTSTAFLGLTMECAQCHDHKFDPMTQREYFEMGGFFNSLVGKGNTKGSTAPTLRMLPPEKEARLSQIGTEIGALEKEVSGTPPQLLADFEKWQTALDKPVEWQAPELVSHSGEKKGEASEHHKKSEVAGRFVRIASKKGHTGFITISEVEVLSNGRNVARSGTAKQSSNYNGGSLANKAIDGTNDGSFGSCACTKEQEDPWWEVDLGAVTPIDHIVVFNRNDCCPERLNQVSVTVLDAEREVVDERKIGEAPFRSEFVFNPGAPKPAEDREGYEFVVRPVQAEVAAIQLLSERPAFVDSLQLEVVGADGKARPLKLRGAAKLKIDSGATLIALEKIAEIKAGERLKFAVKGDPVEVVLTADPTAAERASLPTERDKRLAHFRKSWPGFEGGRKRLEALEKEQAAIEKSAVVSMIAADEGKMRTSYILMRGEYDKRGEPVEPSAPASIMAFPDELPKNRLGFARWVTDPKNPLTARVAVNRYWQMIFGVGLVKTSEDFGTQGDRPSHQGLLDTLAFDFVASGWDVKRLLRSIVTSATYQQRSAVTAGVLERDPGNRLLSHAPRQRLPAEFIRDHVLSVSGLLVDRRGGPGVNPYQPAVLFGRNAIGSSNAKFSQSSGDDLYRRSLYTYWKRQIPAANMRILGADGRTACRTRREKTNTPLQALVLLNDPQFVEAARVLAERAYRAGGATVAERLSYAFRLATSRSARAAELEILLAEHRDRFAEFTDDPSKATAFLAGGGARPAPPDVDPVELAAYAAVVSLILNLDESISKS